MDAANPTCHAAELWQPMKGMRHRRVTVSDCSTLNALLKRDAQAVAERAALGNRVTSSGFTSAPLRLRVQSAQARCASRTLGPIPRCVLGGEARDVALAWPGRRLGWPDVAAGDAGSTGAPVPTRMRAKWSELVCGFSRRSGRSTRRHRSCTRCRASALLVDVAANWQTC